MKKFIFCIIFTVAACAGTFMVLAQTNRGGRSGRIQAPTARSSRNVQNFSRSPSRQTFFTESSLSGWEIDQEFSSDLFTFVRVIYSSSGGIRII
ncbi:MAG: hypothetical protein JW787_03460 [Sedimentisphaerales bacterium]|nr:hypothetical protein [Sedimentisphaerales bacterium]